MVTVTINGRTCSADPSQTILDAARAAGISDIPTLCWYPKLPIVGNCRICLVSVEGQPKLLPACATTVAEGMVVHTESHAAVENRKGVLRLLLERYPGDHLINGGEGAAAERVRAIRRPLRRHANSAGSARPVAASRRRATRRPDDPP